MQQHLSLDLETAYKQPFRTVADLCRAVSTAGLPRTAAITFILTRDNKLRGVGVELAL